jgi:peptidoglycan/LPS O-acetylase OafA/YrhL
MGAVGMTIFFMLSGYILAYRYDVPRVPIREYALNRIARIYPVYVAAAVLALPWIGVSIAAGTTNEFMRTSGQLVSLIVANAFGLQAWFPAMFHYWNVPASWSISAEVFFYLLFPLLVAHIRPLRRQSLLLLLGIAYVFSFTPGFIYVFFSGREVPSIYYSMPIFRLAEFVLGMCAFYVTRHLPHAYAAFTAPAAYGLTAAALIYLGIIGHRFPLWVTHNWIIVPTIFVLLIALARPNNVVARTMSSPLMVWGGKVSYCFYSFQPLILFPLIAHRNSLVEVFPLLASNAILCLMMGLALLGMAAAGYYFIEEPGRSAIRRRARAWSIEGAQDRRPEFRSSWR